jgi:hypothetical protein
MLLTAKVIILAILVLSILVYMIHTEYKKKEVYYLDTYFMRVALLGKEGFEFGKLEPMMGGNYQLSLHYKNVIFIYKNKDISDLYGAKLQGIVEGICWDMKIDKNSLKYSIVNTDEILIQKVEKDE